MKKKTKCAVGRKQLLQHFFSLLSFFFSWDNSPFSLDTDLFLLCSTALFTPPLQAKLLSMEMELLSWFNGALLIWNFIYILFWMCPLLLLFVEDFGQKVKYDAKTKGGLAQLKTQPASGWKDLQWLKTLEREVSNSTLEGYGEGLHERGNLQAWNVFSPTVSISIFCEMAFNISVISRFVIISWMQIR